ncbi:MAG TPA: hypothetical protein VIU39_16005, partial [Anaerolineales bacterium]
MTNHSQIRFSRVLLLVLIVLQVAVYTAAWLQALRDPHLGTADFIIFYGAGRLARSGEYQSLYDLDSQARVQRGV